MTGSLGTRRACHLTSRRRRAQLAAATALGTILAIGIAQSAQADYTVWTCRGPDGAPVSAQAWQSAGTPIDDFADDCATGGALSVTVPAGRSGSYVDDGGYRFQATGGSRITSFRLWRTSMTAGGLSGTGGGFYAYALLDDFGYSGTPQDTCFAAAGCSGLGAVTSPVGSSWDQPANLFSSGGSPVSLSSVAIAAGCSAPIGSGTCPDSGGTNAQYRLYRAQLTLSDASAPTLDGTVLGLPPADATVSGAVTLAVPVADVGAGVQSATLSLDGQAQTTSRVTGCVEPYTRSSPCPDQTALGLTLDTTALSDGEHQLTIAAADGAGNAATLLSRTVTVDNAPVVDPPPVDPPPVDPPVVDPPAVDPPVVLPPIVLPPVVLVPPTAHAGDFDVDVSRAGLSATKPRTVAGRVLTRAGAPVAGAALALEWRPFGTFSDEWTTARTVTTDASGRFSFPSGSAPRQWRVRLIPSMASSATFVSDPFSVYGRLALSARGPHGAVRNGRTVTLTGRLTGAGDSAEGKEVLVQAVVGGRWQAVDRLRASATGRLKWEYRFQRTRTKARYSFRFVAVKDSKRWPWATVASKTVRVRVLP